MKTLTYKEKVKSIGAHAGLAGPIVGLSMLLMALYYAPWFSFGFNSLSDLGANGYSFIFNLGAVASGILITVFFISLAYLFRKSVMFSSIGVMGGIALEMIGIFNETYSAHALFSAIYFMAIPIAIIGISAIELRNQRLLMRYGIISGIISIAVIAIGIAFPKVQLANGIGFAVNESIGVVLLSLWIFAFGYLLLKKRV